MKSRPTLTERLWDILKVNRNPDNDLVSMHRELIQRELSCSQPSVSVAFNQLVREGYVEVLRKATKTNAANWRLLHNGPYKKKADRNT